MPEQLTLWGLPESEESNMISRTLYEDLQRFTSLEHVYVWCYRYLDEMLSMQKSGVVTEEYVRRQAFQLRCALLARLVDLQAPVQDVGRAAVLVAQNRAWVPPAMPEKSGDQMDQNSDDVVQQESGVTKT